MLAFITFSSEFGVWSAAIFWSVVISTVLTLGFTIVVFIGGLSDLRFLLNAMNEEPQAAAEDAADSGQSVVEPDGGESAH